MMFKVYIRLFGSAFRRTYLYYVRWMSRALDYEAVWEPKQFQPADHSSTLLLSICVWKIESAPYVNAYRAFVAANNPE